jgi:hypothetical protein
MDRTLALVERIDDHHAGFLSRDDAACTLVILLGGVALRMKQCAAPDPRLCAILERSAQSLADQLETMDRRGVLGFLAHLLYARAYRSEIERLRATVRVCDEACAAGGGSQTWVADVVVDL